MKQTGCSQHWMRRSFLTAFTLLLLACGIGENDSENVLAAKEYLAQDQIREAALELRNALQKNPENAEARFLLGQIQLDVGDIASAEKEFRRAAEFAWNAEEVNLALARTLLLQQKYNELLKMIEAGPDWSSSGQADTLALRAAAEAGLGNLEEARRIIDKGSQIKADSLEVLKTQARLQLVGGQVNAALETLRDAIQKYPKDSELLLLSATASVEAQNMVSAKKMLKQVIELDSPKTITLYGRQARIIAAKLYILEKDYARTHVLLDPLLRRDSADLEANYLYGLLAYHEKAYDVAEIHLRKILKRVPSHAPTILLFGTLSYAKGDFEQAARYLTTDSQGLTKEGYFMDCWPAYDRLNRIAQRQLDLKKAGAGRQPEGDRRIPYRL